MMPEQVYYSLSKESLEGIQKNIEEHSKEDVQKNLSNEMFQLFFGVMELGKEVRLTLKNKQTLDIELKIADLFLSLVAISNNLNINLFDALTKKEQYLNGKVAKWF